MAAGSEIKGSRQEIVQGKVTHGIMLHVSDDNSTGKPVVGTTYFTPGDGSVESGVTGRICTRVKTDPEIFPGLYLHTGTFSAFVAYA